MMRFLVSLWNEDSPLSFHRVEAKGWEQAIHLAEHFMDSSLWEGEVERVELEENGILLRRWARVGGEWELA